MHSYPEYIFFSLSAGHTIALGRAIGLQLVPRTVVMLIGALGSGKTTFVKGLADGLGVPDARYVNSPTYNLINRYSGHFDLYHIDLYRLNDSADLDDIGLGEVFDSEGIFAVEWPDKVNFNDLPARRIDVEFKVNGCSGRGINITYRGFELILNLNEIWATEFNVM